MDQPIREIEPLEEVRSAMETRARAQLDALAAEATVEVNEDLVVVTPAQK